jgi:hypothetical protein
MALSSNAPRAFGINGKQETELPVKGSTHIYMGSAVSAASGLLRPLTIGASDTFVGFARQEVNNTGSDSALSVIVYERGYVNLAVTGVADASSLGTGVYASDDNTFTTTSTSNIEVGKVARWISGTSCVVYFEGAHIRSI